MKLMINVPERPTFSVYKCVAKESCMESFMGGEKPTTAWQVHCFLWIVLHSNESFGVLAPVAPKMIDLTTC